MAQFDLRHWWNLVAAAGAVIAVIFFAAQLNHGFLLGLGLLLVGVGERINHPVRSEMERPDLAGYITTERMSWKPNGVGLSLDFFGIALVVISLFLAVFAP